MIFFTFSIHPWPPLTPPPKYHCYASIDFVVQLQIFLHSCLLYNRRQSKKKPSTASHYRGGHTQPLSIPSPTSKRHRSNLVCSIYSLHII